jgi:hypothetical protein
VQDVTGGYGELGEEGVWVVSCGMGKSLANGEEGKWVSFPAMR